MEDISVAVIGSGAAGSQAAQYLAGRVESVYVIGRPENSSHAGDMVSDAFGHGTEKNGYSLILESIRAASSRGALHREAEIVSLNRDEGRWILTDDSGQTIVADIVLLSPGQQMNAIPDNLRAAGVGDSMPDGFLHSDTKVIIIGSGSRAIRAALNLRKEGREVYLVAGNIGTSSYMEDALSDGNINTYEGRTVSEVIVENGSIKGVSLDNGRTIDGNVVLYLEGPVRAGEMLPELGDEVKVDDNWMTPVAGIYAAGDILGQKDITLAAAEGLMAAVSIKNNNST